MLLRIILNVLYPISSDTICTSAFSNENKKKGTKHKVDVVNQQIERKKNNNFNQENLLLNLMFDVQGNQEENLH